MRAESFLLAAVIATAASACGTEDKAQDPTFEAIVRDVFEPRCTLSGSCHTNPTVAAKLDLTAEHACDTLVNMPSCLFPNRMRIVPGNPEDSFFFHKLTGQGLDEAPTGSCGTQTNLLMPFGAAALTTDELSLIHNWIAAGASCVGSGKPMDPPAEAAPTIASVSASRNVLKAGESVTFTVALDKAAPEQGQMITLEMDTSAMSAPVQMVVPAAAASVQFEAYALRPTSRFVLRAHTGQSTKEIVLRIAGLEIAEVLADPIGEDDQLQWIKLRNRSTLPIDLSGYQLKAGQGSYDLVSVNLSGTIPAGSCMVIGGPVQSGSNSEPIFGLPLDFSPNLPFGGGQATGFALFDGNATPVGGVLTPVDTMLVGPANDARLLGPDAEIAAPFCGTPISGMSAVRNGAASCVQAVMQPASCQ